MSAGQLRVLGEVLVPERDEVELEPDEVYRTAGIYSFGKGIFERGSIRGSETSYRTLIRLHANQFVVSRLNGWEGAVDVVAPELEGCLVSNEYPTFTINLERAMPGYLRWIARWPAFWDLLVPRGSMVRRKRVQPNQLLKVKVPLPAIDEQRRITRLLDNAHRQLEAISKEFDHARQMDIALVDTAIWKVIDDGIRSGWPLRELGDAAQINPKPDRLTLDDEVTFVPMAAVNDQGGVIETPEIRRVSDVGTGYKQFRQRDIIFARITPCMQNGKCAIFGGPTSHGFGSTEFHVVRPGPDTSAAWLHRLMRTRRFRDTAAERFTGTAGQQRVPADFLRTIKIPVPSRTDQEQAMETIDRILSVGHELRQRRSLISSLKGAIEPALLNQAFASLA